MTLILGVDGGNSKAIALVARADGTIIGAARRPGSADIYAHGGEEAAADLVREVAGDALGQAMATPRDVGRAVFSMAGADWPEDVEVLEALLGQMGLPAPPIVVNDAIGALAGAVPDGPAVVVSIGTGAATGARGHDGRTWHSSFWQVTHGAAELAREAMGAVIRSELGIRPARTLRDQVLAATGDRTVEAALHRLTGRRPPAVDRSGAIVRALLAAADAGDGAADEIIVRHATGLGQTAAAAARRVGIDGDPYALSLCGGLGRAAGPRLVDALLAAVIDANQAPDLVAARWEPAVGALVVGLRAQSGADAWDAIAARLDATAPPAQLFGPST